MLESIKFLILSNDSVKSEAIKEYLNTNYPNNSVEFANKGYSAKNILEKNPLSIVFIDDNLPEISGIELSIKYSNIKNHIRYFILLSNNNDNSHIKTLVDAGADDFIIISINENVLYNKLRIASRFILNKKQLLDDNISLEKSQKELQKQVDNMVELSAKFLQARMPSSYEMLKNIAEKSLWIAHKFPDFSDNDIQNIKIAAYFCQAGRIFLPDSLLKIPVMSNGVPRDKLMYQVPVAAKEIVSTIERFKGVAEILYHIYENFDGTGIPDHRQKWQIPLSSRIIRVVLDYEENKYINRLQPSQIIEKLNSRINRLYDGRVLNLLEQYVNTYESKVSHNDEESILLAELKAGMILSRDLVTNSGMKLLGKGVKLSEKTVDLILNHSTTDPILGYIYIKSF